MNTRSASLGFTAIEIMIVVAIVGVLAAIVFPTYKEYVQKARRSDAQAALTGLAAAMERNFLRENCYRDVVTDELYPKQVPLDGGRQTYGLSVNLLPAGSDCASGYTAVATVTSGGPQKDDKCGNLTLHSNGRQEAQNPSVPNCWRK